MKKKLTPAESAGSIGYNYKKARRNSGKHTGRRFRIALGRMAVAVMTAAVLALTGVLPAGSGKGTGLIPATVEAAGPPTGTITFYKYTRYNKPEDFPKSGSENVILFNRDGGNYYYMNSLNDCEDGHWLGTNVNVDPRIDPDAESFITRNKWSNYYIYNTDIGYMIYEYYNGKQLSVSCVTSGGHAPYLTAKGGGYTGFTFDYFKELGWFKAYSTTGNQNRTAICYWSGHPGNGVWYGFPTGIRGGYMDWRVFEISRVTYNCINANYSIGKEDGSDPQVYQANGANGGLFLREGVTLTVPKNSILVVKNGPFYVNGTINCYGTILVENGGILTTYDSTDKGSNINLYEGSAMIVRGGGRVYAGCPAGSAGAARDGWLKVHPGASIVNYGLLVAGKCDFRIGEGSAIVENHEGAAMYLGYSVEDEKKFLSTAYTGASTGSLGLARTGGQLFWQASNSNKGKTVFKVWDGATTGFANRHFDDPIKLYSYDRDGKCTVN